MSVERFAFVRVIVAAAVVTLATGAQTVIFHIQGTPGTLFGSAVGGGGDVNGDGIPDFVVGGHAEAGGAGAARVYSGFDGSLLQTQIGAGPGDRLGYSVAILGDASGDGLADMLLGAPTGQAPGGGYPGYVRYLLGGTFAGGNVYGPPLPPQALAAVSFGYGVSVAGAGDVNGDGLADAIVARPGRCEHATYTFPSCVQVSPPYSYAGDGTVLAGGTGAVLHVVPGQLADPFPQVVTGLGDVDGDGYGDFAMVGGGRSLTYSNCFGTSVCPAIPTRLSVRSGLTGVEIWGFTAIMGNVSLAGVGDLDGDGRPDLIWRSDANGGGGQGQYTAIFSGATGGYIHSMLEMFSPSFSATLSCAGVSDLNGDGVSDYVLGEASSFLPFFSIERVRVYSGAAHALLWQINGPVGSNFGGAVHDAGDVNGDGAGDFIVGAQWGSFAEVISGSALPLASVTAIPAGCGAGASPPALSSSTPRIGQTATITLAGAPTPATGSLLLSTIPVSPTIVPGGPAYQAACLILIDFATVMSIGAITTDPAGGWTVGVPIPAAPSLVSLPFALQAAIWPAAGGFAASNALNGILGY